MQTWTLISRRGWSGRIASSPLSGGVFFLFTGRPARSAAMPVLFLLTAPKMGFSPRRINVKVGTGERTSSSVPTFTFMGAKMWE